MKGAPFLVSLLPFYTGRMSTPDEPRGLRGKRPEGSYQDPGSGEIDGADPACLERIPPGSAAGKYNNRTSAGLCHAAARTDGDRVRRRWFSSGSRIHRACLGRAVSVKNSLILT